MFFRSFFFQKRRLFSCSYTARMVGAKYMAHMEQTSLQRQSGCGCIWRTRYQPGKITFPRHGIVQKADDLLPRTV